KVFLLNRDNLGGKAQGPGGTDAVIQALGPFHGLWGHPAVYGGEGGDIYYTQNNSTLLALKYGTDGQGNPALTLCGHPTEDFGLTHHHLGRHNPRFGRAVGDQRRWCQRG